MVDNRLDIQSRFSNPSGAHRIVHMANELNFDHYFEAEVQAFTLPHSPIKQHGSWYQTLLLQLFHSHILCLTRHSGPNLTGVESGLGLGFAFLDPTWFILCKSSTITLRSDTWVSVALNAPLTNTLSGLFSALIVHLRLSLHPTPDSSADSTRAIQSPTSL